jgi:hypothetical protein
MSAERAAPETGGMSMADDNRYYRSNDSYAGDEAAASSDRQENPVSDSLAELARLIGQTDPFADLRRQAARAAEQVQRRAADEPADWRGAEHQEEHQQAATAERDYVARSSHGPAASYYAEPAEEPRYEEPRYSDARRQSRFYTSADPHHGAHQPDGYVEQPLPEQHYESPGVQPEQESAHSAYDDRLGALPSDSHDLQSGALYDGQQGYAADEEDFYEDEPSPRHRKVWMTAAAICALAVVGSASAFGYRAIFGKAGSSAPPPVITANASPIKVVPPAPAVDAQTGKISYDRFAGDKGPGEKVVVREEQPVDVNAVKPEPPRPAPNPVAAQSPAPAQLSPLTTATLAPVAPAAPALASSAPNEPKKVRTVTIKPDQPSGLDSLNARSAAVQTPASRVAGAPPAQGTSNTPQASAPTRLASAPPNVRAPAEPSIAGGFMVQVSSQKSEADAKASYKTLQAKFPNQLQNRSAVIRKADVSGKGTFYRAQVGPFGSSDQANEFCKNLQSAGGQCVVQRN